MDTVPGKEYHCRILHDEDEDDMLSDVYTNDSKKLWENGIVPFVFDKNLTSELQSFLNEAMDRISRASSIKFVKRTGQTDFIKFVDEKEFSSYVGRKGGKQKLSVTKDTNKWPHPIGSSMHELMHALGFYHEHCRPDRDVYVKVKGTSNNYEKLKESEVLYTGPYDFKSIMHYPNEQGVELRTGMSTESAEMGQRIELSEGDKSALKNLYPPIKALRSTLEADISKAKERLDYLTVDNESEKRGAIEREILILSERIKQKLMNLLQRSSPSM